MSDETTLLHCPICGKKVSIARTENEVGERWWFITRGTCKTTRCNCRLFLESEKFTCDWNDDYSLECRAKLVEKWNTRAELGSGTCEWATDSEGVRIDVADTVHMLRSEYDGDHEWDDVVIELAYCKHGGDRWIVRGARGEALACDCSVTGHDDELYDKSDDWENLPTPWDAPEPDGWHKCPECGCTVGYTELHGGGWSIMMDDYQIPYNNCPKCGRPILMCDVEVER